jgi:elongation factor P
MLQEIHMLSTSDFKRGLIIQMEGAPCLILDVHYQSPSARGASTMVKTKYRNLLTSQVLEKTFRSGDKVEEADFERHKGQFLYADGDLLEGTEVTLGLFQGRMVSADPPQSVELTVTETAPVLKNATATAQTKEAVLETGLRLQVPPYLESGEKIKVDTREGRFLSRA